MADLSTLVLESGARTTTQPALIPFSQWRELRRIERQTYRMDRIRKAEASQLAAIESQTRPVKAPRAATAKVTTERAPGEPKPRGRTYELKVIPCTNCGQMTRPANVTADRVPGTVTRRSGLCPDCAPPRRSTTRTTTDRPAQIRLCAGTCGRMTRPAKMSKEDAPDTVPRKVHGKCSTCLIGRDGALGPDPKVDPQVLTDAYLSGLSMRQVATKFGITQSTVKRHITKHTQIRGPKPAKPKPPRVESLAPVRPCAGTCGRLTRPRNSTPEHVATGAVARVIDGKCSTCLSGGVTRKVDPAVLVAEYVAGDSLQKLANRYGITRSTVVYHLDRAGVPRRAATMYNGGKL